MCRCSLFLVAVEQERRSKWGSWTECDRWNLGFPFGTIVASSHCLTFFYVPTATTTATASSLGVTTTENRRDYTPASLSPLSPLRFGYPPSISSFTESIDSCSSFCHCARLDAPSTTTTTTHLSPSLQPTIKGWTPSQSPASFFCPCSSASSRFSPRILCRGSFPRRSSSSRRKSSRSPWPPSWWERDGERRGRSLE